MLSKKFLLIIICFLPFAANAQFYSNGQITYERNFDLKLAVQLEDNYKWVKQFSKDVPDGVKANFTLDFNALKSEYSFQPNETEDSKKSWISDYIGNKGVAFKNQVMTDFQNHTQQTLKKIYEKQFLITDSIPKYRWKIEDDIRVIAGYPCRKAITNIDDSVVVVAFYTDQIMVGGGPESFNGLPGMILGLVIPRLYTSWFATNVAIKTPEIKPLDIPKKTHKVTKQEFLEELNKATKSWWGDKNSFIWLATL
jgi:GLPGLI family protein